MLRSLALLWSDLGALFSEREAAFWFLMAAGALLQAAFWYLASPGPNLLDLQAREPLAALRSVALSVALLLIAPRLLARAVRQPLPESGLAPGDRRFGLTIVLALALLAAVPVWFASGSAVFQATYPWAGPWAGSSSLALASWLATYLLYYLAFESFYRGFLLRLVAGRFGVTSGIWIQALAATLIHVGKPLPELLAALPASLIFGVVAVRSRSLLYPVLLHWLIGSLLDVLVLQRTGHLFP